MSFEFDTISLYQWFVQFNNSLSKCRKHRKMYHIKIFTIKSTSTYYKSYKRFDNIQKLLMRIFALTTVTPSKTTECLLDMLVAALEWVRLEGHEYFDVKNANESEF